jgi:hypothetical protein
VNIDIKRAAPKFSQQFKREVFTIWYSSGKPTPSILARLVKSKLSPDFISNRYPTPFQITSWKNNEFAAWGLELDNQVKKQIEGVLVHEKIEMLKRHIAVGEKMQTKAIEYLDTHELTSDNAAVRLLVEGIRIERESVGIPEAIEKMTRLSDDDLTNEVMELMGKAEVIIEALPDKVD